MNGADLTTLRDIEAEQIRLFRRFMLHPEEWEALMRGMIALKRKADELSGKTAYVPPQPVKRVHKVSRMSNPGRIAYFRKGRA